MRHAYGALLRLFPREYQTAFGAEMLATFDQAARDCRRRGWAALVYFASSELAGLAAGLAQEWTAKWTSAGPYLAKLSEVPPQTDLPLEAIEAQRHVRLLVSRTEFAIAHHDFPKARLYCEEERVTRLSMEKLFDHSAQTVTPGLCNSCVYKKTIVSDKGSIFLKCLLSERNSNFPKYPRLPVLACAGWRDAGGEAR